MNHSAVIQPSASQCQPDIQLPSVPSLHVHIVSLANSVLQFKKNVTSDCQLCFEKCVKRQQEGSQSKLTLLYLDHFIY